MKVTRIALAVLTFAVLAACSSDVTGPSSAKPTVGAPSTNLVYGSGEP